MQITFPKLRFQDGQDVASRPGTCARADAGKAEGILLSSRGPTHGVRPTPCALPPFRPALATQYWPSQRDVAKSYGKHRVPTAHAVQNVSEVCRAALSVRC